MKKLTKSKLLALTLALVMVLTIALAACNKTDEELDALENYVLDITTVSADFTLPGEIGDEDAGGPFAVTWESSKESAIKIEKGTDGYNAKVTLDDSAQEVTLTLKLASGKGTPRTFTVHVAPLTLSVFINNFKFEQNGMTVYGEFELPATATYGGKSATITWSEADDADSQATIKVVGNKCTILKTVDNRTTVKIRATFSYNGSSATKTYTFYVDEKPEHLEEVNAWYSATGETLNTISGWVVAIGGAYSSQYKNASFYLVDDDGCSAYYIYQSGCSADDGNELKAGVHVTVTGAKSTTYNGLWETTGSSANKFVIDRYTDKDEVAADQIGKAKTIDLSTLVYNLDNDLLAYGASKDAEMLVRRHTGALVKLTNWDVSATNTDESKLLTLKKGDATINVGYSKYLVGPESSKIKAETAKYTTDSTVTITGLLYYTSNSFIILPRSESDITAGEKDTTEKANFAGTKVAAAIAKVNQAVAGYTKGINVTQAEVNLPTTEGDVAISYHVCKGGSTITVDEQGKLKINVTDIKVTRNIQAIYTIGEDDAQYTTYTFFTITSQNLDDTTIVTNIRRNIDLNMDKEFKVKKAYNLPGVADTDFSGLAALTITWTLKTASEYATVAENKLTVTKLPEEDAKITLHVAISLNSQTQEKDVEATIKAAVKFNAITEPKEGTFKLAMWQGNAKSQEYLFATGSMSGYYYGTTNDPSLAANVVIKKVGDNQYTITIGGKYAEVIARTDGKEGVNVVFNTTQTEGKVWQWNDVIKNFVMVTNYNKGGDTTAKDTEIYYLGTYSTNVTFSATKLSYLADYDEATGTWTAKKDAEGLPDGTGGTQWVGHYGTIA